MSTLRDIINELGNNTEEYEIAFAEAIYIAGGLDSKIKEAYTQEEIESILSTEMTLPGLAELLKQNFYQKFRPAGMERQQVLSSLPEKLEQKLLQLFEKLGFFCQLKTSFFGECTVVICGSTEVGIKERMEIFNALVEGKYCSNSEDNLNIKKVALLTGHRDLWLDDAQRDPSAAQMIADRVNKIEGQSATAESIKEKGDALYKKFLQEAEIASKVDAVNYARKKAVESLCHEYGEAFEYPTEADIMKQFAERLRERGYNAGVFSAPKKKSGERPNTEDATNTFINSLSDNDFKEEWSKQWILVSNQPYAKGQEAAVRNVAMQSSGKLEVIASSTKKEALIAPAQICLCELALTVGRENKLRHGKMGAMEEVLVQQAVQAKSPQYQ